MRTRSAVSAPKVRTLLFLLGLINQFTEYEKGNLESSIQAETKTRPNEKKIVGYKPSVVENKLLTREQAARQLDRLTYKSVNIAASFAARAQSDTNQHSIQKPPREAGVETKVCKDLSGPVGGGEGPQRGLPTAIHTAYGGTLGWKIPSFNSIPTLPGATRQDKLKRLNIKNIHINLKCYKPLKMYIYTTRIKADKGTNFLGHVDYYLDSLTKIQTIDKRLILYLFISFRQTRAGQTNRNATGKKVKDQVFSNQKYKQYLAMYCNTKTRIGHYLDQIKILLASDIFLTELYPVTLLHKRKKATASHTRECSGYCNLISLPTKKVQTSTYIWLNIVIVHKNKSLYYDTYPTDIYELNGYDTSICKKARRPF